ncbi:hypothetical protein KC364_g41 [Hortaea werneckii]|nr:hypothetical protein KC364_g41 [Hortaea werneckii]
MQVSFKPPHSITPLLSVRCSTLCLRDAAYPPLPARDDLRTLQDGMPCLDDGFDAALARAERTQETM